MEIFKLGLELISLPFVVLEFPLKNGVLGVFLVLRLKITWLPCCCQLHVEACWFCFWVLCFRLHAGRPPRSISWLILRLLEIDYLSMYWTVHSIRQIQWSYLHRVSDNQSFWWLFFRSLIWGTQMRKKKFRDELFLIECY